jgi:hypothetical protein
MDPQASRQLSAPPAGGPGIPRVDVLGVGVSAIDMDQAVAEIAGWVGLGTPKQERWMAEHTERLSAPALLGVGAAFNIHAGLLPPAPPWMQRSGLEWLYRLTREPRLASRYLRNNPRFLFEIMRRPPRIRPAEHIHA